MINNGYDISKYDDKELNEIISKDGGVKKYYYINSRGEEVVTSKQNTAFQLRTVISQWYTAIRSICLVLMMSVLLYIAIRMLLSTIAQDKAKYKQMMVDWVVGMCLLFFMHYIMAFSIAIVKQFTDIINSAYKEENETIFAVAMEDDKEEKLKKAMEDLGEEYVERYTEGEGDEEGYLTWPGNLMGKIRLQAQLSTGSTDFIAYGLCFCVLVAYSTFFTFTYLKRVIYMAFLTMIAPFVALTYPIDKLNDGQAQGFNKWLKEYIFNLLIQPLHLLLYTVLVLSAFELASTNIIYMLVAIAFLIPAEKLLRSFFGFEKSETAGSLAGAAVGAGLMANGLQNLLQRGKSNSGGKSSSGNKLDGEKQPKFNKALDREGLKNNALGDGNDDNNDDQDNRNQNETKNKNDKDKINQKRQNKNTNRNNNIIKKRNLRPPKAPSSSKPRRVLAKSAKVLARPVKFLGRQAVRLGRGSAYVAKQGTKRLVGKGVNVLSKVPRYALNAAAGASVGMIGATLGLASGDVGNVVKFTSGAALAGGALSNKINSYEADDAFKQGYEHAYLGKDYDRVQEENQWKQWRKNEENIRALEKNLGKQRAKEMLKNNGDAKEYYNNGIDDINDIIALEQMINDSNVAVNNQVEAMGMYAYAQQSGDLSKMKAKDQGEWKSTYTADIKKRCNYSDEKADKKGEQIYNSAMAFWQKRNSVK